jgi:hypothetical protein
MDTETEQQVMDVWYDLTESHPNAQAWFGLIRAPSVSFCPTPSVVVSSDGDLG